MFRSPEREALQRSRRISSASSQDSVDDDNEMEAMAKVWAHPEDLHLFPVRPPALKILCQRLTNSAREGPNLNAVPQRLRTGPQGCSLF